MKGKKNRAYPDVDVGDEVKIFRKRKPNEKERVSNWSQNIYTLENIENNLGQKLASIESKVMIGSTCGLTCCRLEGGWTFRVQGSGFRA